MFKPHKTKRHQGFKYDFGTILAERKKIVEKQLKESKVRLIKLHSGEERDLEHMMHRTDKERLEAINKALKRWKKGTYGYCQNPNCPAPGRKIIEERLVIVPEARYCTGCQINIIG